jgi:hypothetical protein
MNVSGMRESIEEAQVDPTYYSLEGDRHEDLCLVPTGQSWNVFHSERGQRREEHEYTNKDEACTYFLRRLFQLWRPR